MFGKAHILLLMRLIMHDQFKHHPGSFPVGFSLISLLFLLNILLLLNFYAPIQSVLCSFLAILRLLTFHFQFSFSQSFSRLLLFLGLVLILGFRDRLLKPVNWKILNSSSENSIKKVLFNHQFDIIIRILKNSCIYLFLMNFSDRMLP